MSKRMLELLRPGFSTSQFNANPNAGTSTLQQDGSDTDHTGESTGDLVGGCGTGVL
jgi:hypothetical protein